MAASTMAADGLPEDLLAEAARSGIDLAAALARMGGNRGVYQRLLVSFARDLGAWPGQFDTLLHQRERVAASHLMHTIKGLAATLGFKPLASVAAEAEKALRGTETPDQHGALAGALRTAAATALQATTQLKAALQDATHTPVNPAPHGGISVTAHAGAEGLHEVMHELMGLLRSADMRALDVFEQLQHGVAPQLQTALQPLADAMAVLDFKLALARCGAVTVAVTR
jgi:HPt (histidine-containing phosphotransfer) domain-containing protein